MVETSDLSEWAMRLNKPEEELKKELDALYNSTLLQGIPNIEDRTREALRILKNRYYRGLMVAGLEGEYSVMIFRRGAVRKIQTERNGQKEDREVLNIFGIGKKEGTKDYQYMRLTAWGEDVKNVIIFKPYTVYKVNLREKSGGFNITQNTKWVMDKTLNKEVAINLVRKTMESIAYTSYPQAAGNKKTYVIEGSIIRHFSSERDGRRFSMYGVKPSDMDNIEDLIMTQGLTAWIEPDMMMYGDDSLALFIGSFSSGKDGKTAMNCDAIIPIIEYPLQQQQEDGSKSNIPDDVFGEPMKNPAPTVKAQQPVKPVVKTIPIPLSQPTTPPKAQKKDEMFDNVKIVKSDDNDPFAI